MTNHEQLLKEIASVLERERMASYILEATEENALPRLLVFLGNDYQNRERLLAITAQRQFFTGLPHRTEQRSREYVQINFEVAFPFPVLETAIPEIASLLLFINRTIDLPGLEMDELNNKVLYRYVLLAPRIEDEAVLYLSIVGLIMMILDLFTETIEKIASGKATFNQLLEKMLEVSKVIKE